MNLSSLHQITPDDHRQVILIQDIQRWYDKCWYIAVLRQEQVPQGDYEAMVEYVLKEELSAVFTLPTYQTHDRPPNAARLYGKIQNFCNGNMNRYSRALLFTPKHQGTSEIRVSLKGITLYLIYDVTGR
jgi:hypothetical protein